METASKVYWADNVPRVHIFLSDVLESMASRIPDNAATRPRRRHPRSETSDRQQPDLHSSGSTLMPLILEDTMRVDLVEMLTQRAHLDDRSSPPGDRLIKSQSCPSQAELPISAPYLVPEDHKLNCE